MARMKTFLIYALIIIGFFVFSEFIISVGLNSSYKDIARRDNLSQVEISEAQATLVNAKIKGTIVDSESNLTGKYVEIDLYSSRDNIVGRKYVEINTTDLNREQEFSTYLDAEDIESYSIAIVDEKEEGELNILPSEPTRSQIVIATVLAILIFW